MQSLFALTHPFGVMGVQCGYIHRWYFPYKQMMLHQTLAVFLLSGHLDHGFWRSVEEDQFLEQSLLQLHLSRLPDHENVCAELQDPVHTWQLLKHDGPGDPVEELPDKLPDDQHD